MDILDAIGNTSIVRLRRVVPAGCAHILVKLEWENPTGSLKDRMALIETILRYRKCYDKEHSPERTEAIMKGPRVRTVAAVPGLLILAASIAAGPSAPAPAAALALDRPALLVIDIQNFYFEGGKLPLVGSVEASLKARSVIDVFRAKKLPVIFLQHLPQGVERFEPGATDAQYAIHPNVAAGAGETVIVKHFANSFRETRLAALLKELNVKTLVVTGMQTHMCVEAAVRAGADLGFDIVVVEDACATRDLKLHETTIPAASVHAAALAAMNGTYAKVVTAAEVLAALKQ